MAFSGAAWSCPLPTGHSRRTTARASASMITLMLAACGGSGEEQAATPPDIRDTAPSFGTATVSDLSYVEDRPISDVILPEATGGNGALSYSLSPELPAGLSFTAGERVITGTPAEAFPRTEYTYTVADSDANTDGSDTDTLAFHITVTSQAAIRGTFVDKYQYLEKNDANFVTGPGGDQWSGVAWRGDRAHAPLIILSGDEKQRRALEWEMSDLVNDSGHVIAKDQTRILFPLYVMADRERRECGGYPSRTSAEAVHLADALSSEPPALNLPDDPFKTWLMIDVPQTACPGDYQGHLTVKDPDEQHATTRLSINLQVLPLDLKDPGDWRFELDLWQHPEWVLVHYNDAHPAAPIRRWSEEHYGLLEASYRLLADTGQKTITATLKDEALGAAGMVRWTRLREDAHDWRFDFSAFGAHVAKLMSWGIDRRIYAYGIVGWNRDEIPYWSEQHQASRVLDASPGSSTHTAVWREFLREFRTYLKDREWFALTYLAVDERPGELAGLIGMIQRDDPNWKIALSYSDPESYRDLVQQVDSTSIYLGTAADGALPRSENKVRTIYTSCNYDQRKTITGINSLLTADSSPADIEWITWYAEKLKQDGFSRWAYDYWQSSDPLDLREGLSHTSGDYAFIYRSSNDADLQPMTSVRLETLRYGVQSFEKRRILRELLTQHGDASGLSRLDALISDDYISIQSVSNGTIKEDLMRAQNELDSISMDASSLVATETRCN